MSGIRLDREHGLAPHILQCQNCGAEDGIALLGDKCYSAQCYGCKKTVYGITANARGCPHCSGQLDRSTITLIDKWKPIPHICDKCIANQNEMIEVVKAGGVFWKCKYGHEGAIRKSEYANAVRKSAGVAAPELVGVEFDAEHCPVCQEGGDSNDS